jgi:hypothetical protein
LKSPAAVLGLSENVLFFSSLKTPFPAIREHAIYKIQGRAQKPAGGVRGSLALFSIRPISLGRAKKVLRGGGWARTAVNQMLIMCAVEYTRPAKSLVSPVRAHRKTFSLPVLRFIKRFRRNLNAAPKMSGIRQDEQAAV